MFLLAQLECYAAVFVFAFLGMMILAKLTFTKGTVLYAAVIAVLADLVVGLVCLFKETADG